MILFAADLDNTLIASYRKLPADYPLCETLDGRRLSYLTPAAYRALLRLPAGVLLVPVTTRSSEQYRRVRLPGGEPEWALCCNGGVLLHRGAEEEGWRQESEKLISGTVPALRRGMELLGRYPAVLGEARMVENLFVFAKSERPEKTLLRLREAMAGEPVVVDGTGQKVYLIPAPLSKGAGLARLRKRLRPKRIVAAGDSLLDLSMLRLADVAAFPAGSPLAAALAGHPGARPYGGEAAGFGAFAVQCALGDARLAQPAQQNGLEAGRILAQGPRRL